MYSKTDVATFKLDDSNEPGLAKIELLKPTRFLRGYQCWQVKITEIIKPSKIRLIKIGKVLEVSEGHFIKEA